MERSSRELNKLLAYFKNQDYKNSSIQALNITKKNPKNILGWNILGISLANLGNLSEAIKAMRKVIELDKKSFQGYNNLANMLREANDLDDALLQCKKSIEINPKYAEAYCNLGNIYTALNKYKDAEESYRKSIDLRSDLYIAYVNLANILILFENFEEAVSLCRKALFINKNCAEAYAVLSLVSKNTKRYKEAILYIEKSLQINPHFAEAYCNLGSLLIEMGQLNDAKNHSLKAIQIKPELAESYNNLGVIYKLQNNLEFSINYYRKAISLKPNYSEAIANLAESYCTLGQYSIGENLCTKAHQIDSKNVKYLNNLGNILIAQRRWGEAEKLYRKALLTDSDKFESYNNLLFNINYTNQIQKIEMFRLAKEFGLKVSKKALPKCNIDLHSFSKEKLRVGFVSGDLRMHPVGYFLEGLIENFDKSKFELFAFSTFPEDDSLTKKLKLHFHHWIPINGFSDYDAAQIIYDNKIQILIDLSGHSAHNRLQVFSYKPAPIQASWLGYFATTGLPEIDYFFSDNYMSSNDEQKFFVEKLFNLPDIWISRLPPKLDINVSCLPAKINGFITFGNFGNLSKINTNVIELWSKILSLVPNSKLLIKSKQLADENLASKLQNEFLNHGINQSRLILEPPSSSVGYYHAYHRIDIVLDTFPYPGGTTTFDSLWMGVPVLTLSGDRFLSRLGGSILFNSGLSDWVADNGDDYILKAVKYSSNHENLTLLRSKLRNQVLSSAIFDIKKFTKNFELSLLDIWKKRINYI